MFGSQKRPRRRAQQAGLQALHVREARVVEQMRAADKDMAARRTMSQDHELRAVGATVQLPPGLGGGHAGRKAQIGGVHSAENDGAFGHELEEGSAPKDHDPLLSVAVHALGVGLEAEAVGEGEFREAGADVGGVDLLETE